MADPPSVEEWARQEDLRAELARLNRTLAKEREEKIRLEETVRTAARAAFTAWPAPQVDRPPRDTRRKGAEVAVAMCSDWHYGAQTADFSREVCERRVRTYAQKIIELADIQRADHPVHDFRLWLLGDLVTGEMVFPTQAFEIDSSAVEQAFGVGRLISDLAVTLLGNFQRGTIVGVPGNHSLGSTKHSPWHPDTRLDTIAYLVAQERLAKVDGLEWRIGRGQAGDSGRIVVDRIGEYGCLLTHGDLFRGGNSFAGLPYYSFANKALKWRDMSLAGQMPPFNDLASGHWHRTTSVEIGTMTLRVSGSLETYDPWARETIAAATRPAQTLMFVEPARGRVTAEYRVDL